MRFLLKVKRYIKLYGFTSLLYLFIEKVTFFKRYNYFNNLDNKDENISFLIENSRFQNNALKYSIVVPLFNTNLFFLEKMIESVLNQTYSNFELCLHNGGSEKKEIEEIVKKYSKIDSRIKYKSSIEKLGISTNTNEALKMATGDYIGLLDHDDLLHQNALEECYKVICNKAPDVIYTDEDKITKSGKRRLKPHRKSDWAPDTLMSYNYVCHFLVFNRKLLNDIEGFNSNFDGSQDFDFILRLSQITNNIYHIPKILYHWRISETSTSGDIGIKQYAITAGQKSLEAYYKKINRDVIVNQSLLPGVFVRGFKNTEWSKKKILIVVSGEFENSQELIKYYNQLNLERVKYAKCIILNENQEIHEFKENCEVILKNKFNFSNQVNSILLENEFELCVFINYNTEILVSDWLEKLILEAEFNHVGAVAPKIIINRKVESFGLAITKKKIVDIHNGINRNFNGYFLRNQISQNFTAASPHILLVKKDVFDKIGYLDEALKTPMALIEYCLRINSKGKFIKMIPLELAKCNKKKWLSNYEENYILSKYDSFLEEYRDRFYPIDK
ncbi:glycosyltransferase family 2 protein [Lysinibacillus capsici]|uniref:glycosyltransferase family 2 protein n=1 Tax=Lysinibacillus capsici TaxID=2115968 RepID=UPI001CDA1230|nr:glycosyltransferase [Lysinibacillus capsici]